MLQKLNERIQGFFAWLIIILIAITFTLFGLDYYLQSRHSANVKAVVNDKPVKLDTFEFSYRRARAQQDMTQLSAKQDKQLQKNVLEQLITNIVAVQAALKAGFQVSLNQANAAIMSIPQFHVDGHFSPERYQQALSSAFFTSETFQDEVQQGMLLNQQRFAFMGTDFVLPKEVKQFVRLYMQTRNYDYLIIPYALFLEQTHINDNQIKTYYDKHQNEFKTPEKVSLDYIELSLKDIKSKTKISESDVKRYYEENKHNYLTPAQWKVSHILFAIPENAAPDDVKAAKEKAEKTATQLQQNPGLFSQKVKELSDDKLSVAEEGMLPWLVAGQNEFDKDLLQLTKPDQISSPVRTQRGFELFKLHKYKPASVKPFSQVDHAIKAQLLAEASQKKYTKLLEALTELSYQNPDSLKAVAKATNLPLESTNPITREGGNTPLTNNKGLIKAAFSHEVLELGNNSDPIQINNNTVVVLRVKTHYKPHQKPFLSVKESIKTKLKRQAAIQQAEKFGQAFMEADKQNELKMLEQHQLIWKRVENSSRENEEAPRVINQLAFTINHPNHQQGRLLANGNYAVVHLNSIEDGKLANLDKEQQKSIAQQIEANYGMMAYDLYITSLLSKARIERH